MFEVFQTTVVTIQAWHILCAGWGQREVLLTLGWEYSLLPMVSGIGRTSQISFSSLYPPCILLLSDILLSIVSCWVQLFYAYRICVLGVGDFRWISVSIVIALVGTSTSHSRLRILKLDDRSVSLNV